MKYTRSHRGEVVKQDDRAGDGAFVRKSLETRGSMCIAYVKTVLLVDKQYTGVGTARRFGQVII